MCTLRKNREGACSRSSEQGAGYLLRELAPSRLQFELLIIRLREKGAGYLRTEQGLSRLRQLSALAEWQTASSVDYEHG